ncbi:LADA_0G03026g1_1 [Lachancea dasiensis]|uniref:Pre-mRNA-processing factor 19 n=1 Tax=Lachancea dasiensis TaxID=1072105 RepID=A0A1G4JRW0_9SACH|nr:LADA_0G03026g1_1 [Lachancea dasiensis]
MFCAISGRPLKAAVFSPNSKCVFEKSLIESYIQQHGVDPITKDPLEIGQLVEIGHTPEQYAMSNAVNSSTLKSNYSIPNLLSSLQDEWDAVMLENFQLRQQLEALKVELSTSMYQREAAMNVATRATLECESLKKELSVLTQNLAPAQPEKLDISDGELSDERISEILRNRINNSGEFAKESRKNKFRPLPCSRVEGNVELITEATYNGSLDSAFINGNIANGKLVVYHDPTGACNILSVKNCDVGDLKPVLRAGDSLNFAAPLDTNRVAFGTQLGAHGIFSLTDQQEPFPSMKGSDQDAIVLVSYNEVLNADAYVVVSSSGVVSLADVVQNRVLDLKLEMFPTDFAHMHKDGLLLLKGNTSRLIVHDFTDLKRTAIEFEHDINNEGPIKSAEFASNGYWLVVQTSKKLKIFDLRKSTNTLAMEPVTFNDQRLVAWELDPSMKELFLVVEDEMQSESCSILFYELNKPAKKWDQKCVLVDSLEGVRDLSYLWDANSAIIKVLTNTQVFDLKIT